MENYFEERKEEPKWQTADPVEYGLLKTNARNNRKEMTEAEAIFWQYARSCGLGEKCRRQYIIGDFIVDFFFRQSKVVVEIDGEYHFTEEQKDADRTRQHWLETRGYTILRFTNEQIIKEIEYVITTIREHLTETAKSSL